MPEDLVEEVGRMIGYDSIPPVPPLVRCAPSYDPPEREFLRTVRRTMAAQGFTEVSNYSFISEEEARRFGFAVEDHVRVLNPIAAGQELLRTSLLPGIHRNIVENAKHFDQFRIFEIGREIHKQNEAKPDERPHLMAALYAKDDGRAGLLELKRTAECLAPGLQVRPAAPNAWEHTARCAEVWWQGRAVGRLSELHPKLVEAGRAAVLDLDLTILQELALEQPKYKPVHRFPTSAFDLSIVTGVRALAGRSGVGNSPVRGRTDGIGGVRTRVSGRAFAGRPQERFVPRGGGREKTLSSAEIAGFAMALSKGSRAWATNCGFDRRGYNTQKE